MLLEKVEKLFVYTFTLSVFVVVAAVVVAVVSRTFTVKVHPTWKNKHFKLANNWKKIEKRRKLRALHKI